MLQICCAPLHWAAFDGDVVAGDVVSTVAVAHFLVVVTHPMQRATVTHATTSEYEYNKS